MDEKSKQERIAELKKEMQSAREWCQHYKELMREQIREIDEIKNEIVELRKSTPLLSLGRMTLNKKVARLESALEGPTRLANEYDQAQIYYGTRADKCFEELQSITGSWGGF